MVQSPESSFHASAPSQRKRRRDDLFPDPTVSTNTWTYLPDHHHHHRPLLLTSKFPSQKLLKPRTASPPHRQGSFSRSSPKLKRMRRDSDEDYQMQMQMQMQVPVQQPRVPERCHVCKRVQSLVMPSFGTITVCDVCDERTCYVCTRKCDGCDETVCSKCSEEKEVHSFCRRCMGAWKGREGCRTGGYGLGE